MRFLANITGFFMNFELLPISFGHLKKFLFLVTVAILDTGRRCRTQF
jgi:hypothetical protein